MWSEEQIAALNRLEWPPTREFHATISSTNDRARELVEGESPATLPAVVVAGEQQAGRGRIGREWWSPRGALLMSLAWPASAPPSAGDRVPPVALWAGIGVADGLSLVEPTLPLWLKWPNDIMAHRTKLGGILVERAGGRQNGYWIVGIGINVNNDASIPKPVDDSGPRYQPTSLFNLTGRTYRLFDVLRMVLGAVREALTQMPTHSDELVTRWRGYCGLHGRWVRVAADGNRIYEGTCCGIDDSGALRVQTPSSHVVTCTAGSVVDWR